jgi:AsmA family protein
MREVSTAVLAAAPRRARWPAWLATAAGVALLLAVAAFEFVGWPFLAEPIQQWLSTSLGRRVSFAVDGNTLASVRVRLLGRLRIEAPQADIAAPGWSRGPSMLHARDVAMTLGYADLWRAHRGKPLRIRLLQAAEVDASFERLADGRASWVFGRAGAVSQRHLFEAPLFDRLVAEAGTLRYRDDPAQLRLDARIAPTDASADPDRAGLRVEVQGRWRDRPLRFALQSVGGLPWVERAADAPLVPVLIHLGFDDARVMFDGRAADLLHLARLSGRFEAAGDSLTPLGEVLGLALPGRAAFDGAGAFGKEGDGWRLSIERLAIGTSELQATLALDRSRHPPLLSGRLVGPRLMWGDLAPMPQWLADAAQRGTPIAGRFDVPAWRGVDADVHVDVAQADFRLPGVPPGPLQAHWQLARGQLAWNSPGASSSR